MSTTDLPLPPQPEEEEEEVGRKPEEQEQQLGEQLGEQQGEQQREARRPQQDGSSSVAAQSSPLRRQHSLVGGPAPLWVAEDEGKGGEEGDNGDGQSLHASQRRRLNEDTDEDSAVSPDGRDASVIPSVSSASGVSAPAVAASGASRAGAAALIDLTELEDVDNIVGGQIDDGDDDDLIFSGESLVQAPRLPPAAQIVDVDLIESPVRPFAPPERGRSNTDLWARTLYWTDSFITRLADGVGRRDAGRNFGTAIARDRVSLRWGAPNSDDEDEVEDEDEDDMPDENADDVDPFFFMPAPPPAPRTPPAVPAVATSPLRPLSKQVEQANKERGLTSKAPTSLQCAICLDDINKMAATTCGHVFCEECIQSAVRAQHKCPVCRHKLTSKQIHPLFV